MSGIEKMLPPPDRRGGGGKGLTGLVGGLGGAITCLCCLSALGLIGLWAAFIPFVAFFKYLSDLEGRASGRGSTLQNSQQIIFLLMICFLTIRFVKRQIST